MHEPTKYFFGVLVAIGASGKEKKSCFVHFKMTKKKTKASVAPEVAVVAPPAAVVPVVTSVAAVAQTTPPEVDFITREDSFSYGKPDVNPPSKKEARPQWLVAQHEADFPLVVGAAAGAAAADVAPAEAAAAPSSKPASGGTGSRASRVKAPASAITIKPARSGPAVVAADAASVVPQPRQQQAASAASPAAGATARGLPKQPASTETTRLHFDEPFEQQIQAGIPMGDDFECDVNGHY